MMNEKEKERREGGERNSEIERMTDG